MDRWWPESKNAKPTITQFKRSNKINDPWSTLVSFFVLLYLVIYDENHEKPRLKLKYHDFEDWAIDLFSFLL